MALPFPQSKNHLLSVVDNLTYTERFKYPFHVYFNIKRKDQLGEFICGNFMFDFKAMPRVLVEITKLSLPYEPLCVTCCR
jgi:hypothetical protein